MFRKSNLGGAGLVAALTALWTLPASPVSAWDNGYGQGDVGAGYGYYRHESHCYTRPVYGWDDHGYRIVTGYRQICEGSPPPARREAGPQVPLGPEADTSTVGPPGPKPDGGPPQPPSPKRKIVEIPPKAEAGPGDPKGQTGTPGPTSGASTLPPGPKADASPASPPGPRGDETPSRTPDPKREVASVAPPGDAAPAGLANPKPTTEAPGRKVDVGSPRLSLALRVLSDQPTGQCDTDEIMIGAYCTGEGGKLHVSGTSGASCEGESKPNVVVVCSKR